MPEVIRLDEVKRIEGHGRVSLFLGDDGLVNAAHFDIVEFRGFEKMLQGRMVWEMPLLTSRICGVCPVSHHLAAVKAVDNMYGVDIPKPARLLRELLHLGGMYQDHALHFFLLAGPDFLIGEGQGSRDILGVVKAAPELALAAIGIRTVGQSIVRTVGGRASHPVTAIPGGMSKALSLKDRDEFRRALVGTRDNAMAAARLARETTERLLAEHPDYAVKQMPMMGLQATGRVFDLYDGAVTVMNTDGTVTEEFSPVEYQEHIGERVVANSYAKSPYLLSRGDGDGSYRVGPLARVNMSRIWPGETSSSMATEFRLMLGEPVFAALAYHWARMIELVAVYERMETILDDPDIISTDTRVQVDRGPGVGIAAIEAPRGTLFHHYEADAVGRVTKANLIVATTHNTSALDSAVLEAVQGLGKDEAVSDGMVRRMEMGIRAHDPCLSCATHEVGAMPLVIDVLDSTGACVATRGVE